MAQMDRGSIDATRGSLRARSLPAGMLVLFAVFALAVGLALLAGCSTSGSLGASGAASGSAVASGSAQGASAASASPSGEAPPEGSAGALQPSSEGVPPEPPSGEQGRPSDGAVSNGQPPEPPSGQAGQAPDGQAGQPPEKPSGEGQAPDGAGASGGPGGADPMTYNYKGEYRGAVEARGEEVSIVDETVTASEPDQNAGLAIAGGTLNIKGGELRKSGDDSDGDRCNFYGANAIVLAANEGSRALVENASLTAESEGSNALFATDAASIFANNVTVGTTANSARGLDATYGGTIVGSGITATTQGDHCAAVATDRGGGRISVANATLSTAGSGSPILYSTGDIEIDNVSGLATGSQLVGMEGLNSVIVSNSYLKSTQTGKTASDPIADGIIIYQSTSGDAEASTGQTALFQATGSTLSSAIKSGALFYLTNTQAKVVLSNTTLDFDSKAAKLIVTAGNNANNWGSAGKNGATATFTGIGQKLEGDVEVDTISLVDLYLLEGSSWTGAAAITENAAGSSNGDHLNVSIDSGCTWTVTGNSTVTNLNIADGGSLVDTQGKAVKVADADGNVLVEAASDITVKVTGKLSTSVSTSEANKLEDADIDRTGFDEAFQTSTAFGQNGTASAPQVTAKPGSNSADEAAKEKVDAITKAAKALFGIAS